MDVQIEGKKRRSASRACEPVAIDQGELRLLLTSLSHELCRPLVSLRAGIDLLLQDTSTVTGDQRLHLATMVSLCDDLLRLTRGYLDYAGLVNGSRLPSYGTFSMGAIIREIDRQFRSATQAAGLRWETFADNPDAQVVTDASLCQQIFGNLVSNAIKYTPRGGHVRIEGRVGPDDWLVNVTDDGAGIPSESLERVFEPFFRLSRDEHSRIEGNGLGLSICRELTEQLGGTILLDSTPGAGTTVQVRFPRDPATKPTVQHASRSFTARAVRGDRRPG
jgi:signal transduction histidine kinase